MHTVRLVRKATFLDFRKYKKTGKNIKETGNSPNYVEGTLKDLVLIKLGSRNLVSCSLRVVLPTIVENNK